VAKRNDQYTEFREHLRRINSRCKRNKIYTNISLQDLKDVWEAQDGVCPYTSIKLKNPSWNRKRNSLEIAKHERASIDRINPELGYVRENIQFVSMLINFAKWSLTDKEMHDFIRIIRESNSK
jgi:hypothetical protein